MISNLAITTPILGTIRVGDVATNPRGKRYPVRTNHFKITSQFKDETGRWVEHPMHKVVATATQQEPDEITEIPIRLMFNDIDLNMRARYEAFSDKGRTVCAGDGKCAKRIVDGNVEQVSCPGAEHCAFGENNRCNLFARLNVMIEGQNDQFSSFILRTESINAVRTLYAKLRRMSALFGNRLVGVPFLLKLRQKASSMSCWTKFWYADLVLNKVTVFEAMKMASEYEKALADAGLNQQAFEAEALAGLQMGAFEEGSEDFDELEAFLLAREEGDAPATDDLPTSPNESSTEEQAPGHETGLEALRQFLSAANEAGELTINLTQGAGGAVAT